MREVEVWRGGLSHDKISLENRAHVSIYAGGAHAADKRKGFKLSFSIASKGGGKTSIYVWIGSKHFDEVLKEMVTADPEAFREAVERVMPKR